MKINIFKASCTLGRLKKIVWLAILLFLLLLADAFTNFYDLSAISFRGFCATIISVLAWEGILLIPAFLLGRLARWFYLVYFAYEILILSIIFGVRHLFGFQLGGEWVDIAMASSPSEVCTFIREETSFSTILTILVCCLLFFTLIRKLWSTQYPKCNAKLFALSVLCTILYCTWQPFAALSTTMLISQTRRHLNFYKQRHNSNLNVTINPCVQKSSYPFVVFVLGESATRNRLGIYGYKRQTTPQMSAIMNELVVFSDLITSAPNTAEAMKFLFTDATLESQYSVTCSLSSILAKAGYRCVLFSAQDRWGTINSMESICFEGCVKRRFAGEDAKHFYDDSLLKYLDDEISNLPDCPEIVFLHLIGSHAPAIGRYPPSFSPFKTTLSTQENSDSNPKNISNHYDNSIAFTDKILGDIIIRLRKINRPSMMIYLSDHGESIDSDHWRVTTDINVWEVPFICWFSPSFRHEFPSSVLEMNNARNQPLQSVDLLPGFVSLLQVVGYSSETNDFHNVNYKPKSRFIHGGKSAYDRPPIQK